MFSLNELKLIRSALIAMEKSVMRLANKDGQPENVVTEYRKSRVEVSNTIKHVEQDYVEQEAKEKLQASSKKGA